LNVDYDLRIQYAGDSPAIPRNLLSRESLMPCTRKMSFPGQSRKMVAASAPGTVSTRRKRSQDRTQIMMTKGALY
jgi:hypothetical protein